jgi:hypothetical protein
MPQGLKLARDAVRRMEDTESAGIGGFLSRSVAKLDLGLTLVDGADSDMKGIRKPLVSMEGGTAIAHP